MRALGGAPGLVLADGAAIRLPRQVRDDFDRAALGSAWTDLADIAPDAYARCGIVDGWLNTTEPDSPMGVQGIGGIVRDMGTTDVTVSARWCGDGAAWPDHVHEVGPVVHWSPDGELGCMGIWLSEVLTDGVAFIGALGNPPELFWVQAIAYYDRDQSPHVPSIRSVDGEITVFRDGHPLQMWAWDGTAGEPGGTLGDRISSLTVPEELRDSTVHGVCLDQHLEPDASAQMCDWVSIVPAA